MFSNIKNVPICSFIATVLIIIFFLIITTVVKLYPCGKNFRANLVSNFVHVEPLHLLSNLFGIYVLSRVEKKIGPVNFIIVVSSILLLNTIFETLLHIATDSIRCSIGFSAILYGIFAWEMVSGVRCIDKTILLAIIGDIIASQFNKNIAVLSHFIGIISGAIIGLVFKYKPINL